MRRSSGTTFSGEETSLFTAAHNWRDMLSVETIVAGGQAISFCRLSSAGSGRPQKAMACHTLHLPMSLYLCAPAMLWLRYRLRLYIPTIHFHHGRSAAGGPRLAVLTPASPAARA